MSSLLFSSYFSKDSQNPPDEEMEVRRNLESLLEPDRVETAFGSVLAIERSLVGLVDEKSRSSPVVVFRDESNEVGGFELILELSVIKNFMSDYHKGKKSQPKCIVFLWSIC